MERVDLNSLLSCRSHVPRLEIKPLHLPLDRYGSVSPHPPKIDPGGEDPEQPGREVHPKLVKRHGIMAAGPNDENVLYRDQDPANENEPFDLRIARLAPVDADFLHERTVFDVGRGRLTGDELDQIREHVGGADVSRFR